jgi:hypothetical protein
MLAVLNFTQITNRAAKLQIYTGISLIHLYISQFSLIKFGKNIFLSLFVVKSLL